MSDSIIHINNLKQYQDLVLNSPCIVKFTASWCGPCKALSPLYLLLSQSSNGNISFLEVDLDENGVSKIIEGEEVESIPLLIFYNDGIRNKDLDILGMNPDLIQTRTKEFIDNVLLQEKGTKQCIKTTMIRDLFSEALKDITTEQLSKNLLLRTLKSFAENPDQQYDTLPEDSFGSTFVEALLCHMDKMMIGNQPLCPLDQLEDKIANIKDIIKDKQEPIAEVPLNTNEKEIIRKTMQDIFAPTKDS